MPKQQIRLVPQQSLEANVATISVGGGIKVSYAQIAYSQPVFVRNHAIKRDNGFVIARLRVQTAATLGEVKTGRAVALGFYLRSLLVAAGDCLIFALPAVANDPEMSRFLAEYGPVAELRYGWPRTMEVRGVRLHIDTDRTPATLIGGQVIFSADFYIRALAT